jgi:Sec-independent protein translocase protein TatA
VFGIGIGEILLIVLVTFLVAPKEIPVVLRKLGQFFGMLGKLRDEFLEMRRDVEGIVGDAVPDELRRRPMAGPGRPRSAAGQRNTMAGRQPVSKKKPVPGGESTRGMRGDGI